MSRFADRHVNQITGIFVLLAVLISGVGIYMAGRAQHWFERTVSMNLLLPEEGCYGLRSGAAVMVMGTGAGEVTHIEIGDDDRMKARIVVREDFARFVDTESRATIKKTLGMAGDAFVEITGSGGRSLPEDTLIETTVDRAINDMLQETLDQIRNEVLPTIRTIRVAAERSTQLVSHLDNPGHPAIKALERLESIATKIDEGDGLANRLLADEDLADGVSETIDQVRVALDETSAMVRELRAVTTEIGESAQELHKAIVQSPETMRQINATLKDIRQVSSNLIRVTAAMPDTLERVNEQVQSLSGVVIQVQATLREIQRIAEATQRHWLIRGYVEEDEPDTRIAPREVIVAP